MLKKILLAIALLLVVLVAIGMVLPRKVDLRREITIAAPPAKVHEWVGELKRWDEWAPWKKSDPSVVTTLGDKTSGVGAHQKWTSRDGDGWLTLTKCDPTTGIAYDMAFVNGGHETPFKSAMEYKAAGNGTLVAWTMQGEGMTGMMLLDGWMRLLAGPQIEKMFDQGLADLKAAVEKG
jgi:hypothetical protein